jgi:hypothetical protein
MKRPLIKSAQWAAVFIVLLAACCACDTQDSLQEELGKAYERFPNVDRDAYLALNTTVLPDVMTGEYLQQSIARIEGVRTMVAEGKTTRVYRNAEDYEIDRVWIEEYNTSAAVIKVKVRYRIFEQNLETDERRYLDDFWHWRMQRVWLVNEEGSWKVESVEFIGWSG